MGIVIITIPGENRRLFANSLYEKTGGKVDLIVIQKSKSNRRSFLESIRYLYKTVGLHALPREFWYAILLRIDSSTRNVLEYFRERSKRTSPETGYLPKTIEVDSINSDEVFNILQKLSPNLMVIWGNTILKPHIIRTAKKAVNLHMGLCPYYRGAVANQYAVILRDLEGIGATIHYAEEKVDSGDILKTIVADTSKPPQELFRDLNDKAEELYLDVAHRLFMGEDLPQTRQDLSESKNFMLKNWIPSVRYKLAKQILEWEKTGVL